MREESMGRKREERRKRGRNLLAVCRGAMAVRTGSGAGGGAGSGAGSGAREKEEEKVAPMEVDEGALERDRQYMDRMGRVIEAYGMDAMERMVQLRVVIMGMGAVGMETAKNIVLAGPKSVTIIDDEPVTIQDLGRNFFLEEKDLGKGKAESVRSKLQELNSAVDVSVCPYSDWQSVVSEKVVVVVTGLPLRDMCDINEYCRSKGAAFIASDTFGVAGYAFSDFGNKFTIRDKNGENPIQRVITDISNEKEYSVITLLGAFDEEGGRSHNITDDDHEGWVQISGVKGMETKEGESINDLEPLRVRSHQHVVIETVVKDGKEEKVKKEKYDPYRLRIDLLKGYSPYEKEGLITQVKKPVSMSYRDLKENLLRPVPPGEFGLLFTDGAKFGRAEQIHFFLKALWKFQVEEGRVPRMYDNADMNKMVALAQGILQNHRDLKGMVVDEIDEDVIKQLSKVAEVKLHPLGAFFGGIVAQEIVKYTGKFTPLNQWLHLDFLELLPETTPSDIQPLGSRYDDLIALFGKEFHSKNIANGKTFMVGCGALGCEFLKNFAMMGFATGPEGLITVTDNDTIEVSNLSRQFLFRDKNVGQPKSTAASASAMVMNKDIRINALQHLVSLKTEDKFPDEFWESLDFVTNALDNVKARQYVDSRCVFYCKPLLESGTLGTKCNVQVIVPFETGSYVDGPVDDGDRDSIAMCTLRNFPSIIEHCIEWARARFEDLFVAPFGDAVRLCNDKNGFLREIEAATSLDSKLAASSIPIETAKLEKLKVIIDRALSKISFEDCLKLAYDEFHEVFSLAIQQLQHTYPEDTVNAAGEQFWSGAKRFPRFATFNIEDETHLMFVTSVANIYAVNYGLVPPPPEQFVPLGDEKRDVDKIKTVLRKFKPPRFVPKEMEIPENEEEEKKQKEAEMKRFDVEQGAAKLQELLKWFSTESRIDTLNFQPADFEKDHDLNFHIDFIASTSNLRAWNYRIAPVSRHKAKITAGKIIPAVATATCSVTGLVMIELLKVLQKKKLESYKDSSNNLGLNMYFLQEPLPAPKAERKFDPILGVETIPFPDAFTKWDKIVVDSGNKDYTLKEFLDAFKAQTKLTVTLLFHAVAEIKDGPARGKFLYDPNPIRRELKALYESKMSQSLLEWIKERYAGSPTEVISPNRKYVELLLSCVDDDDNEYATPSVVYRWKR